MNWDDLKIFLEVGRRGKLTLAAETLDMDHTTLSRRLHRLESGLGVTLFMRNRTGHTLTSEGDRLMRYAERIESAALQAHQDLTGENQILSGNIRISATEGFGAYFLAPRLGRFSDRFPGIQVDLVASAGLLSLSKREADLGIHLARPDQGRLIAEKLTGYTLHAYASRAYLENHPPITCLDDLRHHRLVSYVDDLIYAPELRYFEQIVKSTSPALRSSSIAAQQNYVAAGNGIGILHAFMADQDPRLVRILEQDIHISRTFWLMIHEDVAHIARIRAMQDFLHEVTKENRHLLMGVKG